MNLTETLADNLAQSPSDQTYLLAVSGGPDSMVMLDLMSRHRPKQTRVIYVKHNVRPQDQLEDLAVIDKYCGQHGLELIVDELPAGTSLTEESMRRERYQLLKNHKKPAELIATAHNQDDLIETFLFRLARGTSPTGASGFGLRDGDLVRPLYNLSRRRILEYAREHKVPYILDQTNYTDQYQRNIVRHQLLPTLELINQGARANLLSFLELSRAYIAELSRVFQDLTTKDQINQTELRDRSPSMAIFIIINWLRDKNIWLNDSTRAQWENVLNWAVESRSGSTFALADDIKLINEYGQLSILSASKKLKPQILKEGRNTFPGGTLDLETAPEVLTTEINTSNEVTVLVDQSDLPLKVRSWRSGDRFYPEKGRGTVKVQDLFANLKIPKSHRQQIPIVVDSHDKIVWVCGIRCATMPSLNNPIAVKLQYYAS